jgi:heptaprenyl diphosphate synthase
MTNRAEMKPFLLNEMAKPYLEYDMIIKYTSVPRYVDYRARLLYSFLSLGSPSFAKHQEIVALATSLVQIGLDIHDGIDDKPINGEDASDERKRQLRILAGDYYSARFYQLLAKVGQIQLINKISEAISEVNRLKLDIYMQAKTVKLSWKDQIEAKVKIRKPLFLVFSDLLQDSFQVVYPMALHRLTTCEVILEMLLSNEYDSTDKDKFRDMFKAEWSQLNQLLSVSPLRLIQDEVDKIRNQMHAMITI